MLLSNPLFIYQVIFVAIFGMVIGSFLNVCAYRIPAKKSLLTPSRCPTCGADIPFYRNIPVLTYVMQMGKSACCKTKISMQYPFVEAFTGFMAVATYWHSQSWLEFVLWFCLFICPLIVISVIDFQIKIIPDVISIPFIFIGIAVHVTVEWPAVWDPVKDSLLGIFFGAGGLLLIAEIVSRLKKQEAMGGGDIKLLAMLTAFLGWQSIVFILFASSFLALFYFPISYPWRKKANDPTIPFGPFLAAGAVIFLYYGKPITDWYFQMNGLNNPFFS